MRGLCGAAAEWQPEAGSHNLLWPQPRSGNGSPRWEADRTPCRFTAAHYAMYAVDAVLSVADWRLKLTSPPLQGLWSYDDTMAHFQSPTQRFKCTS